MMTGRTIQSFEIAEPLGEGGMGTVYRGMDRMIDREVAIKVLRPDLVAQPQLLARFRAEAMTLGRLAHPAIATLYAFLQEGDEHFMVMEYVRGETLEEHLHREGALPAEAAVRLMNQVLSGIAYAHGQGVIHRDLKPANLMIRPDGMVKIMDFGIARALGASRLTRTGFLIGTLEYMAPEQIQGADVDHRADLYALGTVLYEMLSGVLPFETDSEYALMQAQVQAQAPPLLARAPGVPEPLAAAVMRALEKSPRRRHETAEAFRHALLDAVATAEPQQSTRVVSPGLSARVRAARLRWQSAAAAVQMRQPSRTVLTSFALIAGTATLLAAGWLSGTIPNILSSSPAQDQALVDTNGFAERTADLGQVRTAVPDDAVGAGGERVNSGALQHDPAPRRQPAEVLPLPPGQDAGSTPTSPVSPNQREAPKSPVVARTDPSAERSAEPKLTSLRIVVHPYGDVFIDGTVKSRGRNAHTEQIFPGTYRVRIVHPVYGTWEKRVVVGPGGQDVIFNFKAERQVTVTSDPPHAEILVDGQRTGRFTPARLSIHQGDRVIEVQKDGFRASEGARRLTLEGDLSAPVHFTLQPIRPQP